MSETWSDKLVNKEGLEKIHDAVVAAEKRTSAEIVPMIVQSSSATGHVFLVMALGLVFLGWLLLPAIFPAPSQGEQLGMVIFCAILAGALAQLDFFRRHFVPFTDRQAAVDRRALLEFYLSRINATTSHTGILVFVSAFERRAVILVDEKIHERFPEEKWSDIIAGLVAKTKAGKFSEGMCEAIAKLGDRVAGEFPLANGRAQHELADRLIVKT